MVAADVYLDEPCCSHLWICDLRSETTSTTTHHVQVRKLSKRFGMFHGICNLLNLAALACGSVHLCALAGRLSL